MLVREVCHSSRVPSICMSSGRLSAFVTSVWHNEFCRNELDNLASSGPQLRHSLASVTCKIASFWQETDEKTRTFSTCFVPGDLFVNDEHCILPDIEFIARSSLFDHSALRFGPSVSRLRAFQGPACSFSFASAVLQISILTCKI